MSKQLKPAVTSKDQIEGSSNAPIELVEYGDYQCSYCGRAYPVIKAIEKQWAMNLNLFSEIFL